MNLAYALRMLESLLAGRAVRLAEGVTIEAEPRAIAVHILREQAGEITLFFEPFFVLTRKDVTLGWETSAVRRVVIAGEVCRAYLSTGEVFEVSLV